MIIFVVNMSKSFWKVTKPVTGMVQFPARLFPIGSVLAAFSVAVLLSGISHERWKKVIAAVNFFLDELYGMNIQILDLGVRLFMRSGQGLAQGMSGFLLKQQGKCRQMPLLQLQMTGVGRK